MKCYPRNVEIIEDGDWKIFKFTDDAAKVIDALNNMAIEGWNTKNAELERSIRERVVVTIDVWLSIVFVIFSIFSRKFKCNFDTMTNT